MVAPTYTFLGFNYSMQNLPHHRTEFAYQARPSKAKAFAGTHAGTETIHRIVSICFANCLVRASNDTI
ncbi:MAG TPA: hypothetical protein DD364_04530 [Ruminococcaceae bacterium]|nr:hypothetical protein [Oscillospiraceae bacterium]